VSTSGQRAICIKEATSSIKDMATEKCSGLMAASIKGTGQVEFKLVLAAWLLVMAK